MAKTTNTFDVASFVAHSAAIIKDTLEASQRVTAGTQKWDTELLGLCQALAGKCTAAGQVTPQGTAVRKALLSIRESITAQFTGDGEATGKAMSARIGQAWHILVNAKAPEKKTGSVQTWARALGPNRTAMLDTGLPSTGQAGRKASEPSDSKAQAAQGAKAPAAATVGKVIKTQHATISSVTADFQDVVDDLLDLAGKDKLAASAIGELKDTFADAMQRLAELAKRAA